MSFILLGPFQFDYTRNGVSSSNSTSNESGVRVERVEIL